MVMTYSVMDNNNDVPLPLRHGIIKLGWPQTFMCNKTNTLAFFNEILRQFGLLGQQRFRPDTPSSFQSVMLVALGDNRTCAISTRMLACWGHNL